MKPDSNFGDMCCLSLLIKNVHRVLRTQINMWYAKRTDRIERKMYTKVNIAAIIENAATFGRTMEPFVSPEMAWTLIKKIIREINEKILPIKKLKTCMGQNGSHRPAGASLLWGTNWTTTTHIVPTALAINVFYWPGVGMTLSEIGAKLCSSGTLLPFQGQRKLIFGLQQFKRPLLQRVVTGVHWPKRLSIFLPSLGNHICCIICICIPSRRPSPYLAHPYSHHCCGRLSYLTRSCCSYPWSARFRLFCWPRRTPRKP